MKKILFGATLMSVSLAGCVSNNEMELNSNDNPQPITFEVAKFNVSSRAESTFADGSQDADGLGHLTFDPNRSFGTYAWLATGHGGEHTNYITNEMVSFVDGLWVTRGDVYSWPQEANKHLDFVSYYPYSADADNDGVGDDAWCPKFGTTNTTKHDYNKLEYVDFVNDGKDLMFSDKAHLQKRNHLTHYYSGVPTLFRHALAKLNFTAAIKRDKLEDENGNILYWRVTVTKFSVGGLVKQGDLTLVTTSPASSSTTQWTIEGNPTYKVWQSNVMNDDQGQTVYDCMEWSLGNGIQLDLLNSVTGAQTLGANYIVIPQIITDNQYFTISYKVESSTTPTVANSWTVEHEITDRTYNFSTFAQYQTALKAWEMGKNITYTIMIDPLGDVITFDPAEVDWDTISGGSLDI